MTPEQRVTRDILTSTSGSSLTLWRNNVGATPVLYNAKGERLRPVRYGLANDSKEMNETLKSGDLIGWRDIRCRCGLQYAVFTSIEAKAPAWDFDTTSAHIDAQRRWAELVRKHGGIGIFARSWEDVRSYLRLWDVRQGFPSV